MRSFFGKYFYLVIWVAVIAAIGGIFIYVVQSNMNLLALPTYPAPGNSTPQNPSIPMPSISLNLQQSKAGDSILIQWANLPGGTTQLNVFRRLKGSIGAWSLWKTLSISSGQLGGGNANIGLGTSGLGGYDYYVQAVGGGGSNSSSTDLWESSSTDVQATSTGGQSGGQGGQNSSSTPPSPTSTPTSTNPINPIGPNPSSTLPPPAPSSTPTGTPYYNPEIQIETYGSGQTGNFWVQHVDQKIQIGWQNLPANTDTIVVLRGPTQNGPWTSEFTQQNPDVTGPSSIQIVDNTLGQPYYYEMNALAGGATLATYGPIYLAPATQ